MDAVFLRLLQGVYTTSQRASLLPSMLFAFTSVTQSSSVSGGIASHAAPRGRRRYTCALESASTWNQTSCGRPHLIKSCGQDHALTTVAGGPFRPSPDTHSTHTNVRTSFSCLSSPMYIM